MILWKYTQHKIKISDCSINLQIKGRKNELTEDTSDYRSQWGVKEWELISIDSYSFSNSANKVCFFSCVENHARFSSLTKNDTTMKFDLQSMTHLTTTWKKLLLFDYSLRTHGTIKHLKIIMLTHYPKVRHTTIGQPCARKGWAILFKKRF